MPVAGCAPVWMRRLLNTLRDEQGRAPLNRYMVRSPKLLTLPRQVGPCQITWLGSLIAIRCPKDLDRIVGRTAATWEPGLGRWLVSPSRAAKLAPKLRRATDPLFRRAGLSLDHD
jgi:hypothetical protein